MTLKTLERECFCGSHKGEVLHTQHFSHYSGHLLPSSYDVVSCINCGFIFADTPAPQSIYDKYYADSSKYEQPNVNISFLKKINAERIDQLVNSKRDTKILDIGCGAGEKLLALKQLGFTNLYGLDPSAECANNLRNNGIHSIHGSIFTENIEEKLDVITLDDVLEHIVDLNRLMQKVSFILNKGGFLILTVPDTCKYSKVSSNIPFLAFNAEHINYFDFNSLAYLGIRHGLSIYEFNDKEDGIFDISCVYRKLDIDMLSAKESVIKHIEISNRVISSIALPVGENIIVWGAGSYLSRLISSKYFDNCNILGFIDNDKHKAGKEYMGSQIYSPDFLYSVDGSVTIVICSEYSVGAIREQIHGMSLKNRIVCL